MVFSDNLLQARTQNTSKRIVREIIPRLKALSSQELNFFTKCSSQEQGYLLWIAVCRRYRFIKDFAIEIIREKYLSLKTELNRDDYDAFFNQKSEWHPELVDIRSSTRNKLRQVLFKCLREADILTDNNNINAPILSPLFIKTISHHNSMDILLLPVFELDLGRLE